MYESRQGGLGTYRVTAWEVTSVEKCRTRCPRPYAVRLELYTLFGVPYGETDLPCGPSGPADGPRSWGRDAATGQRISVAFLAISVASAVRPL